MVNISLPKDPLSPFAYKVKHTKISGEYVTKKRWLRTNRYQGRYIFTSLKNVDLACLLSTKFDPCLGLKIFEKIFENIQRWITKISDRFSQEAFKRVVAFDPSTLWYFPDRLKTRKMCIKAVGTYPWQLKYITDDHETQGMCEKTVEVYLWQFKYVPDQYTTQEMCDKAVDAEPWYLKYVPYQYRTQGMCEKVADEYPWLLKYVTDQYITQEMRNEIMRIEIRPLSIYPSLF